MSVIIKNAINFTKKYPIIRGMGTYAILWPISNLIQQSFQKREKYDFKEALRFSIFGSLYVSPTIFLWVKIASKIIPGNTFKHALMKAGLDQIIYAPFAISGFYLGISLLEFKSLKEAIEEVKLKFIPTYKIGMCVWPIMQTINFTFIRERNRVVFIGAVSFFWTIFLSYMKHLEMEKENLQKLNISKLSINKS